jgi:hypothetical protein
MSLIVSTLQSQPPTQISSTNYKTMRSFRVAIIALYTSIAVARTFAASSDGSDPIKDGCPKDEIACLDVINSSQCIEQLIIEKQAPATKEALVKCIETEGSASTLPGAARVSSNRKSRPRLIRTITTEGLGKDFWLTNASTVDAQDATTNRSTMLLQQCFHRRVPEVEFRECMFAGAEKI